MKYTNQARYVAGDHKNVVTEHEPKGISLTIPDMSQPIEELVDRASRGSGWTFKEGVYFGEEDDFSDVAVMTKQEKLDLAKSVRRYQDAVKKKYQDYEEEKQRLSNLPTEPPSDSSTKE